MKHMQRMKDKQRVRIDDNEKEHELVCKSYREYKIIL